MPDDDMNRAEQTAEDWPSELRPGPLIRVPAQIAPYDHWHVQLNTSALAFALQHIKQYAKDARGEPPADDSTVLDVARAFRSFLLTDTRYEQASAIAPPPDTPQPATERQPRDPFER